MTYFSRAPPRLRRFEDTSEERGGILSSRFDGLCTFWHMTAVAVLLAVAMLAWSKLPSMYCSLRWRHMLTAYVASSQGLKDGTDITQTAKALREVARIALDADEMLEFCQPTPSMARLQGDIYFALGELDQSWAWYSRSRQLDSGNPITLFRIGNLLEKMGQLDKAIQMWSSAGAAPYFYHVGLQSLQAGDPSEAYLNLELAREIDEAHHLSSDFYIALSRAASAQGLMAEAEQALGEGITLEVRPRKQAELYGLLGDLYAYATPAQWQQALDFYQKAVTLAADCSTWRLRLAEAYRMTQRFRSAEGELMVAFHLSDGAIPEYRAEVFMGLGVLYLTECQWVQAAWAFENVLSLTPNNPGALLYLGKSYRLLGRSAEARPLLERALQAPQPHIVAWAQEELNKLGQTADPELDAYCQSIRELLPPDQGVP